MTLTYEQKVYQWASGHYLDDDVPNSFFKLTSDEQFKYLKDNAWQFFEDCRGKDIHQYIWSLSNDVIMKRVPDENDYGERWEELAESGMSPKMIEARLNEYKK